MPTVLLMKEPTKGKEKGKGKGTHLQALHLFEKEEEEAV
jgi:hypothetical protein